MSRREQRLLVQGWYCCLVVAHSVSSCNVRLLSVADVVFRGKQDAVLYVSFLASFSKTLHAAGFTVSVDVASWSPFWDFGAIAAKTDVDTLLTMDTYTTDFNDFKAGFQVWQTPTALPCSYVRGG